MSLEGTLQPGFTDPVLGSQGAFRAVLDAMAQPGRAVPLPGSVQVPGPLSPVAAAVALTLIDHESPLWLDPALADTQVLRAWLGFHCGAPIVAAPTEAAFALVAVPPAMPALGSFALGSETYPHRSTTLILQVQGFHGEGPLLSGPGLATPRRFGAAPLPADFWAQLRENRALFPRGVDVILAGPDSLAALPRSLQVELD